MARPNRTKSRTFRRIKVTTPGGVNKTAYKRRKPAKAVCRCGAVLSAVPRKIPNRMQQLPKTHKRPERPFGGVLCTKCMRSKITSEVLNA